jgi:hypothetical protein
MVKFVINKFLCLRLENEKTDIYVNNKLFNQCKYLLIKVQLSNKEINESLNSIDEMEEKLDKYSGGSKTINIDPEVEFWAHCSNLQVWYENNYNTTLLHRTIAFPLLKELTDAGEPLAKIVFKEQIALRFESGHLSTVQFLLFNGYLDYLTHEEIDCLLRQSKSKLTHVLIEDLNTFCKEPLKNYGKIVNYLEIITYIALKYDYNYIIFIINHLNDSVKETFLEKLILYLNYNELSKCKVTWDRFNLVYEKLIYSIYIHFPGLYKKIRFVSSRSNNDLLPVDGFLYHDA